MAANLGYRLRRERSLFNLDVGDEVYLRLGAGYVLPPLGGRPLEADITLSTAVSAGAPFEEINQSAVEAFAGLVSGLTDDLQGFAGAGAGLHQGFGTPDWRVVVGLRLVGTVGPTFAEAPAAPPVIAAKSAPAPPYVQVLEDRDGDGIVDAVDECPDVPGLLRHGGCASAQLAVVNGDRIDILEKVYFETDRAVIRERSYPVLANVADVMHRYRDIKKIEVQGHADARGSDRHNLDLSRRRAHSVRKFLIALRVKAERFSANGYGETSPISDNHTPEGLAENRRVEFHIVSRDKAAKGAIVAKNNKPQPVRVIAKQ